MSEKISTIIRVCLLTAILLAAPGASLFAQVSGQSSNVNQTIDLSTPEAFLRYLTTVRADVAIASFSLKKNGNIDFREPVILHNPEKQFPLASVVKVIHLAAYAKAVETGRIDPNRPVTLREWEQTYLPGTDGFAHGVALQELNIPIDEYGFAIDQNAAVTVKQMVRAMIRFSDNAVPDWLLANLGEQIFADVIKDGLLFGQEMPKLITGSFLVLENHDKGLLSETTVREISRLKPAALQREIRRLQNLYLNPEWRQAELQWRLVNQEQLGNRVLGAVIDRVLTRGTAGDLAFLLARVAVGNFLSPRTSEIMRANLETSFRFNPAIYQVYGGKGGSLDTGVLNEAGYSIALNGDYAGKRRVTVLFQRRIALDIFDRLFNEPFVSFQFIDKLATDRSLARQTQNFFPLY